MNLKQDITVETAKITSNDLFSFAQQGVRGEQGATAPKLRRHNLELCAEGPGVPCRCEVDRPGPWVTPHQQGQGWPWAGTPGKG